MACSKHGIVFEVDFNNLETVDISIKLDLTERVAVKAGEAGRLDIKQGIRRSARPGRAIRH